jgi:RHS repeat-associated protein
VTIADGWITASYNALNQPVAMGNIGYGISNRMWFWYDPLGRCVKRWIGTGNQTPVGPITYFYYDGWNLIQEGSTATTVDRIYVHGNRMDEIVASAAQGDWLYHHYDARGHCILLTNATDGGIREQYDYDAFGWPYFYTAVGDRVPQSPSGNRFLFTGREFWSDLRIYDFRNRMYQPELGRFLQPDPKQFEAGDYNLYRYCHNDPVNKNDPTGLDDINLFQVDGTGEQGEKDKRMAIATDKATISHQAITVGGHGSSISMIDSHRVDLPATKLAQMIKEVKNTDGSSKYKAGMWVILNSCRVGHTPGNGSDSYAQKVANALGQGSVVKAPTSDVYRYSNGDAKIDHRDGDWKTFKWQKDL